MSGAGEVLQVIGYVVLTLLGIGCILALITAAVIIRGLRDQKQRGKPRNEHEPRPELILIVNDHFVALP